LTRHSAAGRALAAELSTALGPLSPGAVILLALASGIGEELFFRGALQPRVGLWLASALFALAHLLPSWPLALWSAFAFVAGVLFGLLFEGTGNLLAPALGHVLTNAVNLRWLAKRPPGSTGPGI
ncbi:MAG: CPBP family intramembrane glutamic endopeptidase, partial [Myxococcota bacterium]